MHMSEPQKPGEFVYFWCKMVAIRCFVWPPGLRLVRQTGIRVWEFLEFYIRGPVGVFLSI